MSAEIPPIDHIERWRQIVERRRTQMDAAYAEAGTDSGDYWARRAKTYRQALHGGMENDPLLLRVRRDVTPRTTVLDVGAGTGRHTLALAPLAARVTAVEPSRAMLSLLLEDAAAQGLSNVAVVEAEWQAADVEPHDIVICSHVV